MTCVTAAGPIGKCVLLFCYLRSQIQKTGRKEEEEEEEQNEKEEDEGEDHYRRLPTKKVN